MKTTFDGVDVPALLKYKDGIINRLYKGLTGLVKSRGIETVRVKESSSGRTPLWSARTATSATTSSWPPVRSPRRCPGLTIEGRVITSTQALSLEWIPEKAIVLGGGVIGVEFASTLGLIRHRRKELFYWIMERPDKIPPHAKVPREICEQCHVTGRRRRPGSGLPRPPATASISSPTRRRSRTWPASPASAHRPIDSSRPTPPAPRRAAISPTRSGSGSAGWPRGSTGCT